MVVTCCELKWLWQFLRDLRVSQSAFAPLFCDMKLLYISLPILFFMNRLNILRSIVILSVMNFRNFVLHQRIFLLLISLQISLLKCWGNLKSSICWVSWVSANYVLQLEDNIKYISYVYISFIVILFLPSMYYQWNRPALQLNLMHILIV